MLDARIREDSDYSLSVGGRHSRRPIRIAVPLALDKTAQVESFYQEHLLLREMRAVQVDSTNDSAPARVTMLRVLPLGTDKERAVALLRNEGFGCQDLVEPVADTRLRQSFREVRGSTGQLRDNQTKKMSVDCQVGTPNVMGYKHWIVDLEFDADARLSEARVAIWNISL